MYHLIILIFRSLAYLRVPHHQRHTGLLTEMLQITKVGLVVAFFDPYMKRCDMKAGFVDFGTPTQQFGQQQTVFAAAQADQYMVSVLNKAVIRTGFMELSCQVFDVHFCGLGIRLA